MLSLEQCYDIDPSLRSLSEEEVLKIRDQLYALGEIAVDDFIEKNNHINNEKNN